MSNKREYETEPLQRSAGVSDVWHVLSIVITAVCCVLLCLIVNSFLFCFLGREAVSSSGLAAFFEDGPGRILKKSNAIWAIALVFCALMAANAIIYRKVIKKIFEHFAVVFTAAGGLSLIFMLGYSQRGLYFIISSALIVIGEVCMFLYGAAYHALNKKEAQKAAEH